MIELKTYSYNELKEIMDCKDRQSLERKLNSYNIIFSSVGDRAPRIDYTITEIPDMFRTYCVFELGFDPHTEFKKLRHFLYHYFCDEMFMSMPDEVKETKMERYEQPISRQTISKYEERLTALGYVAELGLDYVYYFAYKHNQIITDKKKYCEAWHEYWDSRDGGSSSGEAILEMIANYGGIARKQAVQIPNGIYKNEINYLIQLVVESIEAELSHTINTTN